MQIVACIQITDVTTIITDSAESTLTNLLIHCREASWSGKTIDPEFDASFLQKLGE